MNIKNKSPMSPNYSREQLIEDGKLTTKDLEKIHLYRGSHNRLGFAYQLLYVRVLNYFPQQKPFEIVNELLGFAALQIAVDQKLIEEYTKHRQHIARHQEQILSYLKKSVFNKKANEMLSQYLFDEAQRIEQSTILLNKARQFLRRLEILQPSETKLQRLMITTREKAKKHIFVKLMGLLNQNQKQQLDALLAVEDGKFSKLQQLKQPPSIPSSQGILKLIDKLNIIKETRILEIDIKWLNNNYQRSLSKYVLRCSAHRLRELEQVHRYTALVCFLWQTQLDTIDFMVDMHAKLITRVYSQAESQVDIEMQKKRKDIKKSMGMLKTIGEVLLNEEIDDLILRQTIFSLIKSDELKAQIGVAEPLLSGKFSHTFNLVVNRFSYLRQYAPSFLANIQFENEAAYSGCIINAIDLLREMNQENKRKLPGDVPLQFMPAKLQKMVAPLGIPNKQAWECALLTCLRDEIRSGNLAVTGSKRYGRFDHFFILDTEWEQIRQEFFQRAQLPSDSEKVEGFLKSRLNIAYDQFLTKQTNNHYARIENNRFVLSVDSAEELSQEQKMALERLQSWLASHMRSIKLPELLIEVDNDLHFTNLFMLPSQQNKRSVDDVCAILVTIMAHGCFIGPYTMARLTQGISYEQIRRVTDWQMTEDSQRLALAIIVNAIAKIDVSQHWGEGKTSSSDGQRFEFKRKSLAQTYSTKFGDFALEFYTFVSDNYAPFYSIPIECTDRDASYVLDGILYNESDLALDEHYTDTHGFTEINFAAFAMLGKKFSPRIKGVHHQRLYRIDSNRDYGNLAPLVSGSERQVNLAYIVEQWDRMGQFYASLERGHATASTALKRLVGFSEKNHFYRANRDLGRIFKTENILEYLSDPLLRQNRRRGLLKGEQIHQLARNVAYGKRGKISVRDLHEQKNTCSCLTLILSSIIYWQASEIKHIIDQYGHELDQKCLSMLSHISPIGWDNIILYGEYVLDKRLIK